MCLILMISNISLDQIRGDFVPHRPNKISILPKLSSPQLLLNLRIFLKYLTRRNTLQHPYHLGYRIPRRETQKNMDVVRGYPHFLNLKPMMFRHIPKYLFYLRPYIFLLNPFPIFRCPYQMIFGVVNRMRCSPNSHEGSYTIFSLPSADAPFIPVHRTGFSGANCNKSECYGPLCHRLLCGHHSGPLFRVVEGKIKETTSCSIVQPQKRVSFFP